jgi:hypothetical protein
MNLTVSSLRSARAEFIDASNVKTVGTLGAAQVRCWAQRSLRELLVFRNSAAVKSPRFAAHRAIRQNIHKTTGSPPRSRNIVCPTGSQVCDVVLKVANRSVELQACHRPNEKL